MHTSQLPQLLPSLPLQLYSFYHPAEGKIGVQATTKRKAICRLAHGDLAHLLSPHRKGDYWGISRLITWERKL